MNTPRPLTLVEIRPGVFMRLDKNDLAKAKPVVHEAKKATPGKNKKGAAVKTKADDAPEEQTPETPE